MHSLVEMKRSVWLYDLSREMTRSTGFVTLAIQDVREAADLFRPVYNATGGGDGFVSLE